MKKYKKNSYAHPKLAHLKKLLYTCPKSSPRNKKVFYSHTILFLKKLPQTEISKKPYLYSSGKKSYYSCQSKTQVILRL